jgi:hypothetical protein
MNRPQSPDDPNCRIPLPPDRDSRAEGLERSKFQLGLTSEPLTPEPLV